MKKANTTKARNAAKELIILVLLALLAGVIAGCVYLSLSSILGIKFSRLMIFSSTTIGVVTALAVEGVWKGCSFKNIMLKRVFPAIIGIAIAYYFIWTVEL